MLLKAQVKMKLNWLCTILKYHDSIFFEWWLAYLEIDIYLNTDRQTFETS